MNYFLTYICLMALFISCRNKVIVDNLNSSTLSYLELPDSVRKIMTLSMLDSQNSDLKKYALSSNDSLNGVLQILNLDDDELVTFEKDYPGPYTSDDRFIKGNYEFIFNNYNMYVDEPFVLKNGSLYFVKSSILWKLKDIEEANYGRCDFDSIINAETRNTPPR